MVRTASSTRPDTGWTSSPRLVEAREDLLDSGVMAKRTPDPRVAPAHWAKIYSPVLRIENSPPANKPTDTAGFKTPIKYVFANGQVKQ